MHKDVQKQLKIMKYLYPHFPDSSFWVYDLETYPNIFTGTFLNVSTLEEEVFEISTRRNDVLPLLKFLESQNQTHVGFNNLGFDYPIIHTILGFCNSTTLNDIYQKAQELINTEWSNRFRNQIHHPLIKQIDISIITGGSLKQLEINIGMDNVKDLPFPPGSVLTDAQKDELIEYNHHDVFATYRVFMEIQKEVVLRSKLSKLYNSDFTNRTMTQIGASICEIKLKEHDIYCYENGKKKQTTLESVHLSEIVFDSIFFESYDFKFILKEVKNTIANSFGKFKDLKWDIGGTEYKIGSGGLHISVKKTYFKPSVCEKMIDVDVAGFYVQMPITQGYFTTHLGVGYITALAAVAKERAKHPKKTPENIALKEAGNSVYGNSNQKHSVFYDVSYMLKTTINGQLYILMLIEWLQKIPSFKLIQANTDGLTYIVSDSQFKESETVCKKWEAYTKLELEGNEYSRMWVRDVNSYIAEYKNGGLKYIGCYKPNRLKPLDKDYSSNITALAAEAVMVRGEDLQSVIKNHYHLPDFLITAKVPRDSILMHGDEQIQSTTRYAVTKNGKELVKVSPPKGVEGEYKRANKLTDEYFNSVINEIGLGVWDERIHTKNRSRYTTRHMAMQKGRLTTICNDIQTLSVCDVDYDYYIKEVEKILI